MLGFRRTITHLDNHKFEVKSSFNEIIQPDQWIIIKGKGMPLRNDPESFGDLHVKMKVTLPKSLTAEQVKTIKEILESKEPESKEPES